jgi:hypothetical protein
MLGGPERLWWERGHAQQPGAGRLVRVVEGGKLHRRGGKTHFPHEV